MKKNWTKYILAFVAVLLVRLIPMRAPNLEPIMATQMPFGRVYGSMAAFIFGAASIVVYDSFTSGIGIWTLVTAVAYGLLGLGASAFFRNRTGRANYVKYAIVATIAYDLVTGLSIGPMFFGQSFVGALVGQIPFTTLHLLGNVAFAIVLSPVIEMWAAKESSIEVPVLVPKLKA